MEETLTMAPPPALSIIAGMAAREARYMLSTLTCITRRHASGSVWTTLPRLPIPTLLSRKSSRPKRSTAEATMVRHCSSSVTSAACAAASPPSAAIISAVRSARSRWRSTTSTRVPARARRMAAARPLPMPSPAAPPPVTMATLPARPGSSSGPLLSFIVIPSRQAGARHVHAHELDTAVPLLRHGRAAAGAGADEERLPVLAAEHAGVGAALAGGDLAVGAPTHKDAQ